MKFNKLTAIGTILFNLAMPVCAKMYNPGLETRMERKYSVDLIGDFSGKEIRKISKVMKNIEKKINRKENGIGQIIVENIDSHDEALKEDDIYASATIDPETNTVLMSNKAIKGKSYGKNPLADYMGLFGHEIGHLVYDKCNQKQIFSDFWDYNIHRNQEKKSEIPDGYVSAYPLTRPFMTRTNEDFADIFSYWVNGRHYADIDPIVQKKIDAVRRHTGK